MTNHSHPTEQTFIMRSDPTRRAVVQRLGEGSAPVSHLARPFDMALPSFTRCLGVLENVGVLVSRREVRSRVCSLDPSALEDAEDWMAIFGKRREGRLDCFETQLET